jgi:nitrogen fixation/metabolism regulation signal transduction histidine kinase
MTMTPSAYALLGLTGLVAALVAVLVFAMLRFAAAAREAGRGARGAGAETAFLSAALQEAVTKLKAQERATAARAEASERLNGEIISSLTAGLVMVDLDGHVRILNPAGRRMLDLPEGPATEPYVGSPRVQPLLDVIDESLKSGAAIVRRGITLPDHGRGVIHLGVTVSPR